MNSKRSPLSLQRAEPLSIEDLEAGLRLLSKGDIDQRAFWDDNIEAFRQTVLFAIHETSDALLSPGITLDWRIHLEKQLKDLVQYLDFINSERSVSREPAAWEIPSGRFH